LRFGKEQARVDQHPNDDQGRTNGVALLPAPRAAPQALPPGNAAARPGRGEILGHFAMRGDVRAEPGEWLGIPGSGLRLEAIMLPRPVIDAPPETSPGVDCQIVFAPLVVTTWTPPGTLCGARGIGLGCVGVRFRLHPASTPFFICRYDVAFTDGSQRLDQPGMAPALAPGGAFVEAIRLWILRRPDAAPLVMLGGAAIENQPPWLEFPPTDETVACRLLSPAFEVRPPEQRHGERIPEKYRHAMEVSWNRGVFPASPVTLRVLEEAVVSREGIVFDRDLRVVPATGRLFSDADIAAAAASASAAFAHGAMPRVTGLSVLCKSRGAPNYGHFLVEMLPRAAMARQMIQGFEPSYIVHESDLLPVVRDALDAIGIPREAIRATDGAPIRYETLLLLDGLTNHGIYQSPLCARILSGLAVKAPRGPYKRIFVRRRATTRPLVNEAAVEAALKARGFIAIDPARMTLGEQVTLFKGARLVVGALGAAMTNLAFCDEGTRVVMLTAASFPDTFFWFLCRHRRHHYLEIRGIDRPEGEGLAEPWSTGFTISEDDIAFLATL
jgi:capsular polysaccharide biosynthesis protein